MSKFNALLREIARSRSIRIVRATLPQGLRATYARAGGIPLITLARDLPAPEAACALSLALGHHITGGANHLRATPATIRADQARARAWAYAALASISAPSPQTPPAPSPSSPSPSSPSPSSQTPPAPSPPSPSSPLRAAARALGVTEPFLLAALAYSRAHPAPEFSANPPPIP